MITWDLDPVAFSLGPLEVRWYGLVYAAGFFLGYYVLKLAAERGLLPGMTKKLAEDYIFQLMLGSIIGARLFYVIFYNPAYYLTHLIDILAVWKGGLSIHGGLIGAAIVTWYFCRKHEIGFYRLADILIVPLALVLVFGRLANYVNGELWGRVTEVSWCVEFPHADGCRHPSQIYEALYSYVIFIILLVMEQSKRFAEGVVFWSFILLYGTFRFIVTFFREFDPTDPALLGLSLGQWFSLVMVGIAIWWFTTRGKHRLTRKA
jgi:phosphatidylglycerol:prolipoprotein diacylglycerol transferase